MLEGFHALKHALRFGAEVEIAVAVDPAGSTRSPPSWPRTWPGRWRRGRGRSTPRRWPSWCRRRRRTGVVAIARRPALDPRRRARRPAPGAGRPARGAAQHGQHGGLRAGRRRRRRGRRPHHRRQRSLASRRRPRRRRPALRAAGGAGWGRGCRAEIGAAASAADPGGRAPPSAGRCWRSTPRGRTCGRASCRRAPSSPSAPSATASPRRCSPAPTPASRSRCAPASPASTSRPRSPPSSSPFVCAAKDSAPPAPNQMVAHSNERTRRAARRHLLWGPAPHRPRDLLLRDLDLDPDHDHHRPLPRSTRCPAGRRRPGSSSSSSSPS